MKLFVPGRLCLFGEHTDWAGGYRRFNADLDKGYAVICGTNHGLYADVEPHPTKLILRSALDDGTHEGPFEIEMDIDALKREAEKGGFFSYAAGVAYQVMTHYRVRGLKIDNYRTDLPVKKGLSSSAAISVLVARAFNRIYDLKMTTRGEMEYAYAGEVTTPSRCGRLDQGCAYGNRPVMMSFDGDALEVKELTVGGDLHMVLVDLCAAKDTKEILNRLNHCYPFADDDEQRKVQEYLGAISGGITHQACEALAAGDAKELGRLMTEAQAKFDEHVAPACPSELSAPELHKVLNHEPLKPYIFGGKGVGSQGDGSAQLVAKDEESQRKIIEIVEKDLKKQCLKLDLKSGRTVRKAVIPAAGFGTRLFPASKAIKKELFPIIDSEGRIKPVILSIVEEALSGGIEEVCIVVQRGDLDTFEEFFGNPPPIENYNKLSKEAQEYSDYLLQIGRHVTFVPQDGQEGFGHAVYCAKDWVNDEPFLLLLGDHLYASDEDASCARQVLDAYDELGLSVVGLKKTPAEDVHNFGCVAGDWIDSDSTLSITEFSEKPDAEYAQKHLHVEGTPDGVFFSVFGQYVLKPAIFEYLQEHIEHNVREGGEFQLTSCLDQLRQEDGFAGLVVKGRRFDIGIPEAYRQTVIDFRNA
jgi:UTP-glucose-1-phosphate uridylyltransferase/mevalonate kinase